MIRGRETLDPVELCQLVRAINPTGEAELGTRDVRERYALKSALQSLLVRQHEAELHVRVDPAEADGVVALAWGPLREDACHAVVSELDVRARSIVQRRLDELRWADEAPAEPTSADELDDRGLLQQGLDAVAAYDYPSAQQHLEAALEATGATDAAAALLDLLVDCLADDTRALAVAAGLERAARRDGRVRGYVALAAARRDDEAAASWLEGATGDAATRAAIELANRAVADGDTTALRRWRHAIAQRAPQHAELLRLDAALEEDRLRARDAAESELEAVAGRGEPEAILAAIEATRARFPDSPLAARLARELDAVARETDRQRELLAASAAKDRGDWESVGRHLRRAIELGEEAAPWADVLREVERREADAAAEHALESLSASLEAGDAKRALRLYVAMAPELRERARERCSDPRLAWLDATGASGSGPAGRHAVDAVLALGAAREALEAGSPGAVEGLLRPHATILTKVDATRRVSRAAEARLRADRRAETRRRLDAAEQALLEDDHGAARRHLEHVTATELDGDGTRRLAELERRLTASVEERELRQRLEHAVRMWDVTAAEEVRKRVHADADAPWGLVDAVREARERIQRNFAVAVARPDCPLSERVWSLFSSFGSAATLRLPDGRLVLPEHVGRWVLLLVVDPATERVVEEVMLRMPRAVETLAVTCAEDSLYLAGRPGYLLRLETAGWRPRDFCVPGHAIRQGERFGAAHVTAKGEALWVNVGRTGPHTERCVVWSIGDRAVARGRVRGGAVSPLGSGARAMASAHQGKIDVWAARGARTMQARFSGLGGIRSIHRHPRDEGGLVLLGPPAQKRAREGAVGPLTVTAISSRGRPRGARALPAARADRISTAAVCGPSQRLFVWHQTNEPHGQLTAVELTSGSPVVSTSVPVPLISTLATDATRSHPLFVTGHGGVTRVFDLEEPLPEDLRGAPSVRDLLLSVVAWRGCQRNIEPSEASELIARWRDEPGTRDERSAGLVAGAHALRHEWAEVVDVLASDEASRGEPRQHALHLLAAGLAWVGRPAEALEVGRRALRAPGACHRVADLVRYAEVLAGDVAGPRGADAEALAAAIAACREADVALLAGDAEPARRLVGQMAVQRTQSPQLLARQAAGWVALRPEEVGDPASPRAWRARRALFAYLSAYGGLRIAAWFDPPCLTDGVWPRERLSELAAEAEHWLERLVGEAVESDEEPTPS